MHPIVIFAAAYAGAAVAVKLVSEIVGRIEAKDEPDPESQSKPKVKKKSKKKGKKKSKAGTSPAIAKPVPTGDNGAESTDEPESNEPVPDHSDSRIDDSEPAGDGALSDDDQTGTGEAGDSVAGDDPTKESEETTT